MSATDLDTAASVRPHDDSPFVRACRGLPHDHVPVWFMRQAGRALAEYRAIRERHTFEEVVHTPELAAEVTLQPVRRYGVDAAILFSDIVTPVQALGVGVEIKPGVGPVVERPFRTTGDLDRLRPLEPDDVDFVLDTVSILVRELPVPLIGFAGAPFTVASYLIEGGPSKSYSRTKALMYGEEPTWHRLMERLAGITLASLTGQVERGASAVQLFDSWAGALHPDDYVRYVLPHSRHILDEVGALGVPRIHFGVGTGELLGAMAAGGAADVVGVDWRVPLAAARRRIPTGVGMQGNLEPASCLGPWEGVEQRVRDVLTAADGAVDHIFNLGHGVLPATDPAVLQRVVDLVHREGRVEDRRGRGAEPADG
ncbi:uroporphyrinogen decarboxylase [Egicoccus sp. AB-alg6-2]|uniref:uroporphyrinogen decarboxylase n=1 Tax=Egicoccus sp. AB-alg6-2 TaxID=3242692 RepID=UPI00359D943B